MTLQPLEQAGINAAATSADAVLTTLRAWFGWDENARPRLEAIAAYAEGRAHAGVSQERPRYRLLAAAVRVVLDDLAPPPTCSSPEA